jgi:Ni/Fe-hydrogenase subunit HybB-like protein
MVVLVPSLYVLTVRVFAVLQAKPTLNTASLAPVFLVSALLAAPCVLILLGAFIKRWNTIIPAMLHRNLPLPAAHYQPNEVEVGVAAGLVACGVLFAYALTLAASRLRGAARPAQSANAGNGAAIR